MNMPGIPEEPMVGDLYDMIVENSPHLNGENTPELAANPERIVEDPLTKYVIDEVNPQTQDTGNDKYSVTAGTSNQQAFKPSHTSIYTHDGSQSDYFAGEGLWQLEYPEYAVLDTVLVDEYSNSLIKPNQNEQSDENIEEVLEKMILNAINIDITKELHSPYSFAGNKLRQANSKHSFKSTFNGRLGVNLPVKNNQHIPSDKHMTSESQEIAGNALPIDPIRYTKETKQIIKSFQSKVPTSSGALGKVLEKVNRVEELAEEDVEHIHDLDYDDDDDSDGDDYDAYAK